MNWKWDSLNTYSNYTDRIEKARNSKVLEIKKDLIPYAIIQGQSGKNHCCTLDNCDCDGFKFRRREPCFHIIRLAMELGILDERGLTEQERRDSDVASAEKLLSRCLWHYHVLKQPLVSDSVYDELKADYLAKMGKVTKDLRKSANDSSFDSQSGVRINSLGIFIPHIKYNHTVWRMVNIDDSFVTLWSQPIVDLPFYDLFKCHEARYIRTDYAGKNKMTGKLLRIQERESRDSGDQNAAQRYSDIMQYGSNQWAVSTLREYLNGEFLRGMPRNFVNAIVPQTHDILLRKVNTSDQTERCTEHKVYDDSTTVYDRFINGVRSTYSRVTDKMYLPSLDADAMCRNYFGEAANLVQPRHYWLMDAQISTDGAPYLCRIVTNCLDTKGKFYASVSSCNAQQNHDIWVCPMCVVKADYIRSLFKIMI